MLMSTNSRTLRFAAWSLDFGQALVTTMRPYLLFLSGITGLAGMALVPGLPLGAGLSLALAFFLSYGFGQALTDCFQLDTDSLSAPYRPLVRGIVRRRDMMIASLAGLVLCGVALFLHHPLNLPLALAAIGGLATYTWFKRRWWGGPFYNAWIVALLAGMGYVGAAGAARTPLVWNPALAWTALAAFFGYANFVLAGYFKDTDADRATGYRTLPVVAGFRVSACISDVFALLALVCVVCALAAGSGRPAAGQLLALALAATGAMLLAAGQYRLHRVARDAEAHRAIAPVVAAYVLLLAGVAAFHAPAWAPGLVAYCGAFLLVLRKRPAREQI